MTPQQLRNSILQMAIEGKLTRQLPEDGSAADLLKQIKAEKAKLIKEKKIKKEKPLPEITEDEIPFEIPDNWCWVRLNDIGDWKAGATPSRDNPKYYGGSIPWLKTGDLNDGVVKYASEYITKEAFENNSLKLNPIGSVLMAMYGATIGKLGILQIPSTTNQACCACIPYHGINNKYVFYFLMVNRKHFLKLGSGGAQPNISRQKIISDMISLPPTTEQNRIVNKLEEILPQIETYEKAYNELQELNKTFPVNLKNSLLQMAIEGKLVEQRPEDGNATDLLKKIKAEKAKLIKEKKIRKEKPLLEITEDEIPFEIPDNWCWVRLGEVFSLQAGKNISSSAIHTNGKYQCFGGNGIRGYVDVYNQSGTHPIIGRQGALCGNIQLAEGKFYATEHAVVTNLYADTDARWASIFLKALNLNQYATATAQPGLAVSKINTVLLPLPPLGEQKRIVNKLAQILPLCDEIGNV